MPSVTIALDSQAAVHALHDEIDPITCDLELRNHAIPAAGYTQEHVDFEPAIEKRRRSHTLPRFGCALPGNEESSRLR